MKVVSLIRVKIVINDFIKVVNIETVIAIRDYMK